MSANQKLTKYLREAYVAERERAEQLADVIGRTGRADHRVHLESHLGKEREHAARLEERLRELGFSESPLATVLSLVQGVVTEGVSLATAPLGLLRRPVSAADVLRNAEELAAGEALEAARYRALERLAQRAGDEETATLAASIREQEEAQLDLLGREIPRLADHVLGGDAAPPEHKQRPPSRPAPPRKRAQRRRPSAETSTPSRRARTRSETSGPGKAEAARIRESEREQETSEAREASRDPDADPAGAGAEVHVDEPWPGYDGMSATDVAARVDREDEAVRAAVRLYESAHERRELVMRATSDG
jgi:ferritin-like metal-binding protein YciE